MSQHQDLLSVTAFLSALFHAVVILGISFKLPELADLQNTDNMLDVVLINAANKQKPADAELISSSDSLGGGLDERVASSPIPYEEVRASPIQSVKKTSNQQRISQLATDQFITAKTGQVQLQDR
ncbi:MAG: hypothetical protein KJP04_05160, partial [Arenicella sp.]|nr:hypothetical protein [Arenicella sp.]